MNLSFIFALFVLFLASPLPRVVESQDCDAIDNRDPTCMFGAVSDTGNVCCPAACVECGGDGCAERECGSMCCMGTVMSLGRNCDEDGAPCVINDVDDGEEETQVFATEEGPVESPPLPIEQCFPLDDADPECLNGTPNENVCCPIGCDTCGGDGCAEQLCGSMCCTGTVMAIGRDCDEDGAPCVFPQPEDEEGQVVEPNMEGEEGTVVMPPLNQGTCDFSEIPDPHCTNGTLNINVVAFNGNICCPGACELCGGDGCGDQECGSMCCQGPVSALERDCSEFGPPCTIIEDCRRNNVADPTCSNGLWNDLGNVCCPYGCINCGGDYCDEFPCSNDCCQGFVTGSGRDCDEFGAPCFVSDNKNIEECAVSYGQCGGEMFDGAEECCAVTSECTEIEDGYSQCVPNDPTVPASPNERNCVGTWGQCGGEGIDEEKDCCSWLPICQKVDDYYSQCVPSFAIGSDQTAGTSLQTKLSIAGIIVGSFGIILGCIGATVYCKRRGYSSVPQT